MEDGRQSPIKNGDFPLKPPARRRFGSGIAIAVCLLIALGPVVFLGLPPEIARWYVAAAMEHDLLDQLEAAEADLDKAIEWLPEDGDLYVRRAEIRLQQKDFSGAMDDCQVALQSNGQDFRPALLRRMLVHQRQRHHEKAIADSDLLVEASKAASERAESLNARAYARALGNVQITEGLEDIQAAFQEQCDSADSSREHCDIFGFRLRDGGGNGDGATSALGGALGLWLALSCRLPLPCFDTKHNTTASFSHGFCRICANIDITNW